MPDKPRLLFLSPRVPHPLNTGAKIRTRALLNALLDAYEVDYAGFLQPELDQVQARTTLTPCGKIRLVPEHATGLIGKGLLVLGTLWNRRPATVVKYHDQRLASHVRRWSIANPNGVVYADHIHMAGYLAQAPAALRVIDEHNVEAMILKRLARQYRKSPAWPYFRLQARKMRLTEARLVREANLTLAVSEGDAAHLRGMARGKRVEVIPNGVDLTYFASQRAHGQAGRLPGRLVFTGSMNWFPNEDGVLWFAREIWPLLDESFSLDVVGHQPGSAVRGLAAPRVRVTGSVDDTRPYVEDAQIFIVPLRIGGGSRLKILEAFAMGIPVVSTTVGCEGLGVQHERELVVADSPEAFARAIRELRATPERCAALTTAAMAHVRAYFGWPAIGERLVRVLKEMAEARVHGKH